MAEFTSANNGKIYSAGMSINENQTSETCIEISYWDQILTLDLYKQMKDDEDENGKGGIASLYIQEDKRKQFAQYLRFIAGMIDK